MSVPNAEDLVIEFENQSGKIGYKLFYRISVWLIIRYPLDHSEFMSEVARFKTLREAEACAESLKKSI